MFGTAVLGMCYDLQHITNGNSQGLRNPVVCQILQGVIQGFCGCATTVSTWVGELKTLKRRHAYVYGIVSVGIGLSLLVVIMGSQLGTKGFGPITCRF